MRGGAVVARWAHNPKVVGSSPAPATKESPWKRQPFQGLLLYTPPNSGKFFSMYLRLFDFICTLRKI